MYLGGIMTYIVFYRQVKNTYIHLLIPQRTCKYLKKTISLFSKKNAKTIFEKYISLHFLFIIINYTR